MPIIRGRAEAASPPVRTLTPGPEDGVLCPEPLEELEPLDGAEESSSPPTTRVEGSKLTPDHWAPSTEGASPSMKLSSAPTGSSSPVTAVPSAVTVQSPTVEPSMQAEHQRQQQRHQAHRVAEGNGMHVGVLSLGCDRVLTPSGAEQQSQRPKRLNPTSTPRRHCRARKRCGGRVVQFRMIRAKRRRAAPRSGGRREHLGAGH